MKKFISVLLIVTVILSCVLILTACGNKGDEILGEWYFERENYQLDGNPDLWNSSNKLTFTADGKMIVSDTLNGVDKCENFTWTYNKKEKKWIISYFNDTYSAVIQKDGKLWIRDIATHTSIFWKRA